MKLRLGVMHLLQLVQYDIRELFYIFTSVSISTRTLEMPFSKSEYQISYKFLGKFAVFTLLLTLRVATLK